MCVVVFVDSEFGPDCTITNSPRTSRTPSGSKGSIHFPCDINKQFETFHCEANESEHTIDMLIEGVVSDTTALQLLGRCRSCVHCSSRLRNSLSTFFPVLSAEWSARHGFIKTTYLSTLFSWQSMHANKLWHLSHLSNLWPERH